MFPNFRKLKMGQTENDNFRFFSANPANFRLFAASRNGKWTFVFLCWQTVNGNRRLLFPPRAHLCPAVRDYNMNI
jgi:hypothetical protein